MFLFARALWPASVFLLVLVSCTPTLRLVAVGDVLLDRTPGQRLALVGRERFFGPIRPLFQNADAVFANLEGPVALHPHPRIDKPADLTFVGDPARLKDLAWAGVTVVSLANNHMDDGGASGIEETIAGLNAAGIAHAGAGRNEAEAHRPAVFTAQGYKVALLAYTHVYSGAAPATATTAGLAWAEPARVLADIQSARNEVTPDILIVSVHWGNEFDPLPTNFQYSLARACIDAGATLVLGHHPHVLQGLETRGSSLIAYSLGNAVFSQPGEETSTSVALRLELDHTGVRKIECIPLVIDSRLGAPVPSASAAVLERLRSRSPGVLITTPGEFP